MKILYPRLRSIFGLCVSILATAITPSADVLAQPTISSVANNPENVNSNVTINGSSFNATPGLNIVRFGGARATVVSGSSTSLTVTVPPGASEYPVSVLDSSTRLAAYQKISFIPKFQSSCFYQDTLNFNSSVNFNSRINLPAHANFADFDGDGKLDMAVANTSGITSGSSGDSITLFRNIGSSGSITASSFSYSMKLTAGSKVQNIQFADFDGDGKIDIIAGCYGASRIYVYRNTSTGIGSISFATSTGFLPALISSAYGLMKMALPSDFDGDGKPDFVAINPRAINDRLYIYHNAISTTPVSGFTTSHFDTASIRITVAGTAMATIALADFDGDGKTDVLAPTGNSNKIYILRNTTTGPSLASPSWFSAVDSITITGAGALQQIICSDLNLDGKPDIIVTDYTNGIYIIQNNSVSGTVISSTPQLIPSPSGLFTISSGDLNGDGYPDLVAAGWQFSTSIPLFRNTSTSSTISFAPYTTLSIFNDALGITITDVDGDSKSDIIVANNAGSNGISILRNAPKPIISNVTGPDTACAGDLVTYNNATSGGVWSLNPGTHGTINATTGEFTGSLVGSDTVVYTITCNGETAVRKKAIYVRAYPVVGAISGATTMCSGTTITLSDTSTTGTWSSSATSIATVDASGVVYGTTGGSVTISYTKTNACGPVSATHVVSVTASPAAITGTSRLCLSSTHTLGNTTTGGTWSATPSSVALIGASSGAVTPVAVGIVAITYTKGSCYATAYDTIITVPTVSPITGSTSVCTGSDITLFNTVAGGTWSITTGASSASVGSTSGIVTGISAGAATVTYAVTNTCGTTPVYYPITVNTNPAAITGTTSVCPGANTTLSSLTPSGTWTVSAGTGSATIGSSSGIVTGGTAGTATVTYTAVGGCFRTTDITIYSLPDAISGSTNLCMGNTTTLSSTTSGGNWSVASTTIATLSPSGSSTTVFAAAPGTTTVSYTIPTTGCFVTSPMTINALPASISGPSAVCNGSTISLSSTTGGGSWYGIAGTGSVAVDPTFGFTTGLTIGTATISYVIPATGCFTTTNILVNDVPNAISGPTQVCLGSTITLNTTSTGGLWSSSSAASISPSGVLTGATAGTAIVSYTYPATGCRALYNVSVNNLPGTLSGTSPICPSSTTTFSSATTGGVWSSASTSIADVVSSTGLVTGMSAGTTTLTYTDPSTTCFRTIPITISSPPAPISGSSSVCVLSTTTLSDVTTGGFWSISPSSVANISSSGVVTGVAAGIATVSYTVGTCAAFKLVTVNGLVTPDVSISSSVAFPICEGDSVTFTPSPVNGGTSPTYFWYINNIYQSTSNTFRCALEPGDLVSCNMVTSAACPSVLSVADTFIGTVNPQVTPTLSLSTGIGDTVCLGALTAITGFNTNGGLSPSFQFKVNGIPVGPGVAGTYAYLPADGDVVTCIMTSNASCPSTPFAYDTLRLTVSPYVMANVIINASDTGCEGYNSVYTAVPIHGGTAPTYVWKVNGVTMGTGSIFSYIPTDGDIVTCTMTSNFPCATFPTVVSAPMTMHVFPVDLPVVSIATSPGFVMAPGTTATFTATVTDGGTAPTYQWYKNSVLIPGATNNTYVTNVLATDDSITCQVTNHDLCNGITVFGTTTVFITDNVGIHDVNANGSPNIILYPNPNSGSFSINGYIGNNNNETATITITNLLGQVVYATTSEAKNGLVDTTLSIQNTLSNGTYMLTITSTSGKQVINFNINR